MRVVITGTGGHLGRAAVQACLRRGYTVLGLRRIESAGGNAAAPADQAALSFLSADLTDRDACLRVFERFRPDALFHCAAWTGVDAAEQPENRLAVFRSNTDIPRVLAQVCRDSGCKLLFPSTDYVFDGSGSRPWDPEQDEPHPLNVYGLSKLLGEQAVRELLPESYVVRTSWLFGCGERNFVRTMLHLGASRSCLQVVDDQIGRPTYAPDLAELLCDMAETDRYGCYHAVNEGPDLSRYELVRTLLRQAGLSVVLQPVSTAQYGSPAVRPLNSRLDTGKLCRKGFRPLPPWQDALLRDQKDQEA